MSWSLLVLLQLTVLICLLSMCASETNSLRDSRCFLLFCQAPTSSRRCCCSIHAYLHTHIHTDIHTYIHWYIHACMHAYMHTQPTHTGLYVHVIAKELALSEATWCYWISVFSIVYLAGLLFGCKSITRTYSSTHNLLRTNPSPSLFSFLLSPCYLYLSFAACWKKLTCGVIRSFNFLPGHLGKTEATRNSGFILRLLV